jgi:hypothetical protein
MEKVIGTTATASNGLLGRAIGSEKIGRTMVGRRTIVVAMTGVGIRVALDRENGGRTKT